MSVNESSQSSSLADEWIGWFCSLNGNHFFCEIERSYIEDSFNLFGLKPYVSKDFSKALDTILDRSEPEDVENQELVRAAALLYGLIHARYIVSINGLEAMRRKYLQKDFGECQRWYCSGQAVLPMGLSDDPKQGNVKMFCPRCRDVYCCSVSHRHIDGAYFGTTFPHLFFMTYEGLTPSPPNTIYTPRVFGFKIHASSSSLPKQTQQHQQQQQQQINTLAPASAIQGLQGLTLEQLNAFIAASLGKEGGGSSSNSSFAGAGVGVGTGIGAFGSVAHEISQHTHSGGGGGSGGSVGAGEAVVTLPARTLEELKTVIAQIPGVPQALLDQANAFAAAAAAALSASANASGASGSGAGSSGGGAGGGGEAANTTLNGYSNLTLMTGSYQRQQQQQQQQHQQLQQQQLQLQQHQHQMLVQHQAHHGQGHVPHQYAYASSGQPIHAHFIPLNMVGAGTGMVPVPSSAAAGAFENSYDRSVRQQQQQQQQQQQMLHIQQHQVQQQQHLQQQQSAAELAAPIGEILGPTIGAADITGITEGADLEAVRVDASRIVPSSAGGDWAGPTNGNKLIILPRRADAEYPFQGGVVPTSAASTVSTTVGARGAGDSFQGEAEKETVENYEVKPISTELLFDAAVKAKASAALEAKTAVSKNKNKNSENCSSNTRSSSNSGRSSSSARASEIHSSKEVRERRDRDTGGVSDDQVGPEPVPPAAPPTAPPAIGIGTGIGSAEAGRRGRKGSKRRFEDIAVDNYDGDWGANAHTRLSSAEIGEDSVGDDHRIAEDRGETDSAESAHKYHLETASLAEQKGAARESLVKYSRVDVAQAPSSTRSRTQSRSAAVSASGSGSASGARSADAGAPSASRPTKRSKSSATPPSASISALTSSSVIQTNNISTKTESAPASTAEPSAVADTIRGKRKPDKSKKSGKSEKSEKVAPFVPATPDANTSVGGAEAGGDVKANVDDDASDGGVRDKGGDSGSGDREVQITSQEKMKKNRRNKSKNGKSSKSTCSSSGTSAPSGGSPSLTVRATPASGRGMRKAIIPSLSRGSNSASSASLLTTAAVSAPEKDAPQPLATLGERIERSVENSSSGSAAGVSGGSVDKRKKGAGKEGSAKKEVRERLGHQEKGKKTNNNNKNSPAPTAAAASSSASKRRSRR